jgi:nitrite reductase (NO-forming)
MNSESRSRSQIDRRALLRTGTAAGLALPFGGPALALAQDEPAEGTPDDGYIGSDPKAPSTGGEAPNPSEPQEFQRRDPFLLPIDPGPKEFSLVAQDRSLYISKDVAYAAWTFNGTVPGPFLHAVQGDEIDFTFSIDSETSTGHSVDFHSAEGDPVHNYKTIFPGEDFSWKFTPNHPGAFMYHCGTPPVLMHIGAGMYSAMIVRPKDGWPTEVSQELIFVQSDFYFQDIEDAVKPMDYNKMLGHGNMDYTSFNGHATQYVDEPIKVKAGEPLRIYVVNAGPNVYCTFHVVGGIFDAGYFNANPENKVVGLQSMTVGPGDGIAVELTLKEPGLYPAVNHAFGHAAHGAIALLEAE